MICVYVSLALVGIIGCADSHIIGGHEDKENLNNVLAKKLDKGNRIPSTRLAATKKYIDTYSRFKGKNIYKKSKGTAPDIVDIKLFYEVFCPHCIKFERDHFAKVLQVLSHRLFIHTYPYGNANTTVDADGHVEFQCQHGARECYGNTIHACALNHIANRTQALLFNVCMMGLNGSDDVAADKCAKHMNIDKSPILQCAKGKQGTQLLRYYGEESKKAGFKHVPFVLVNGSHWNGTDLLQDLCSFFQSPPIACLD